jgi:hypothetical protein
MKTLEKGQSASLRSGRLVSRLAENVAFISWHKHWKGIYLHCVHPRYCVRLFAWGVDWHLKAKHALQKPANTQG